MTLMLVCVAPAIWKPVTGDGGVVSVGGGADDRAVDSATPSRIAISPDVPHAVVVELPLMYQVLFDGLKTA